MQISSNQPRPVISSVQDSFQSASEVASPGLRGPNLSLAGRNPATSAELAMLGSNPSPEKLLQVGMDLAAREQTQRGLLGGGIGFIRDQINGFFGPDSSGQAGWMDREGLAPTKEITNSFEEVYAAAQAGEDIMPEGAEDLVYLTVDGLTGENFPFYMEPNRKGLSDRGLDVREVMVDTEAGVETNAATVRDAILKAASEGKQVVLIGHSKGGLDSAAAVAMYPELKDHVRALVTLQSPYGGAPLATDLQSNPITAAGVKGLAEIVFNGSEDAAIDLTYESRQDFIEKYPFPSDEIPTVSMMSTSSSQLSLLSPIANYTYLRYGESSDGLVVDKDAAIPGSNVVSLEGLDHIQPVMPGIPNRNGYDVGDMTAALVSLALTTPPPNAARA